MLIVKKVIAGYDYFFNQDRDPRTVGVPLMDSPFPLLCILGFYYWFVTNGGIKFMKHRKPFKLNRLMMIYNLAQVLINGSACIYAIYWTYWQDYFSFKCQPIHRVSDVRGQKEFFLTYLYFLIKLLDLVDTVFMVLRKRHSHISFLHLYHHVGIAGGAWIAAKFIAGGHLAFMGIMNASVHTVMYFYYFLTAFKPELKTSIWWKKHITQLQMVQFTCLMFHFGRPLILYPDCQFPAVWMGIIFLQSLFMNLLFADFYYKAYIRPKRKTEN